MSLAFMFTLKPPTNTYQESISGDAYQDLTKLRLLFNLEGRDFEVL